MDVFDLEAVIKLDTSDYEKGIDEVSDTNDVENAMENIGNAVSDVEDDLDDLGDTADSAGDDLDDLGDDAGSAANDLDDLADTADDTGNDIDSMGDDADDAASSLDDLADSADDLAGSLDNVGDSTSGAVDGLSDLGSSLGGSGSSVSATSSIASAALDTVGGAVKQLASGNFIGAAITAVAGLATGIASVAKESKTAKVDIAQMTGATGDELDELAKNAKNALGDVSLASKTNLDEVSKNLAEVNTRLGYTGEQLEDTTSMMTDFAIITGQDGVAAVDAIADTMSHWQLEAEDMPGLLDDITTASQASGTSAADLESALSNNSAAFQQLGMDIDDSLAFLSAYTLSGGDASDATAILKSAVSNLSGEVDDVPGTFQAAIDAIASADNASDALTATVGDTGLTVEDVFGTKSANKMIQAVQSEQFSIEDMTEALATNEGQMQATAEESRTFKDVVTGAFNGVKTSCGNAFSQIGDTLTGWGSQVIEKFKGIGGNLISGMQEGIGSKVQGLYDSITGACKNVVSKAKNALGISSPSRVFRDEVGDMIGEGLALGIEESTDDVYDAMDGLIAATDMSDSVNDYSFGTSAATVSAAADYEDEAKGGITVIQNIYSQAQTAADLMREARYEQERAVLMGV